MFGRGRSRREYRVYAEDQYLGAQDLGFESAGGSAADGWSVGASGEVTSDEGGPADASREGTFKEGWLEDASQECGPEGVSREAWAEDISSEDDRGPVYTAPPRRLLGRTNAGRTAGIAVLAAAAMVLSAIVVHALRPAVEGGGTSRPSVAAPASVGAWSATRGVQSRGGAASSARVDAGGSRVAGPVILPRARWMHSGTVAGKRAPADTSTSSAAGEADATASAHASAAGEGTAAPARPEQDAPARPEFGFER
jgi:hypothetical protein